MILGELGERRCDSGQAAFTRRVLGLVDAEAARGVTVGVIAWAWNARTRQSTGWHCPTGRYGEGGPVLIRDYAGTPTVMGRVFRDWVATRARRPFATGDEH